MRILYIFLITFAICLSSLEAQPQIEDSKGTDFWVCFLPNYHNNKFSSSSMQKYGDSLYLFIVADVPTKGLITYWDSTGREYTHNFSISNPNEVYAFKVSYFNFELIGFNDSGQKFQRNQCERVAKQSFHITSDNDIIVYGHSQAVTTSDAFMVFPTDILGNDYLVMAYNSDTEVDGTSRTPSQFAVIASEDNTLVQINTLASTYANGTGSQEVLLNKGEVYLVQADVTGGIYDSDLTGSSVNSNKPIAVFAGQQRATVPVRAGHTSPSRDFLASQIPPVKTWGKNSFITPFIDPKGITGIGTDLFRVLAAFDSTIVKINGNDSIRLDRGEFYEGALIEAAYISANFPILVAQFKKTSQSGSNTERISDPFFVVIPPKEQFMSSYKVMNTQAYEYESFGRYKKVYTEHYITIVAPESIIDSVILDGKPIETNLFKKISNSNYYYANVKVEEGQHQASSSFEFGIIVYGYGQANSYGYVGGLYFKPYDFKAPAIYTEIDCYELIGAISDSALYDSGIISITVPENEKINTKVKINDFSKYQKLVLFTARLIDKYQDGQFSLNVVDSMGFETNRKIDIPGFTLKNEMQSPDSVPSSSYVGRLNSEYCLDIAIENYGKFEQVVKEVLLNYPEQFRIESELPMKISPGKTKNLRLCFLSEFDSTYIDSVLIADDCAQRNILNLNFSAKNDRNAPQSAIIYDPCFEYSKVIFYDSLVSDYGLEKIEVEYSLNCKTSFKLNNPDSVLIKVDVIDYFQDAIYSIIASDSAGHSTRIIDTIQGFTLSSPLFKSGDNYIHYKNCYINYLYCDSIQFFNHGLKPIVIENPILDYNVYFSIPQSQFPFVIEPQERKSLAICFSPINARVEEYYDTLHFVMNCIDMPINLKGDSKEIIYEGQSNCELPIIITSYGLPQESYLNPPYPNPTNSVLNIDFGLAKDENVEFSVFDIYGSLLRSEVFQNYKAGEYSYLITVEDFPQGQYLVRLKINDKFFFAVFIKYN